MTDEKKEEEEEGNANQNKNKKDLSEVNSSSSFDNVQHYNNCLTITNSSPLTALHTKHS